MRLTDVKKKQYQRDFEAWSAANLRNKTVGNRTIVTTDPHSGTETSTVVDVILTVPEQRSMAAAEYNELVSQARKWGGGKRVSQKTKKNQLEFFPPTTHPTVPLDTAADEKARFTLYKYKHHHHPHNIDRYAEAVSLILSVYTRPNVSLSPSLRPVSQDEPSSEVSRESEISLRLRRDGAGR